MTKIYPLFRNDQYLLRRRTTNHHATLKKTAGKVSYEHFYQIGVGRKPADFEWEPGQHIQPNGGPIVKLAILSESEIPEWVHMALTGSSILAGDFYG